MAKHIILNLSSSVDAAHLSNEYSVSNLHCFIHRGMVDHTSLIWIDRILCHFIAQGMVDHTSCIWTNCNLCRFIVHCMVDRTSLIWINCNLYCSFFVIWLIIPALYGISVNEAKCFCVTQHLCGSIHKFIVFVCT